MQRYDFFFRQLVEEGELDESFAAVENAFARVTLDQGIIGIVTGLEVAQQVSPNMTVQVSGPGAAYDSSGNRIAFASTQNLNLALDENGLNTAVTTPGNMRWVSIFIEFDRLLTNPRLDGNGQTVYYDRAESFAFHVAAGAESGAPTRPVLRSGEVLLADVLLSYGDTAVETSAISVTRRQLAIVIADSPNSIAAGGFKGAIEQLLTMLNDHINGGGQNHLASAVDYEGGPDWYDGTPNPAATVEAQLDKIITDLGSTTSGDSSARRIGIEQIQAVWADASVVLEGSIYGAIYQIINALGNTTGLGGAVKIGIGDRTSWLGGLTNPADTLFAAVNKIITDLISTTTSSSGARRIGVEALANWADATTNPAGSVYARLAAIVSSLASSASANSGAHKIGIDDLSIWADATTNPASTLRVMINGIIDGLGSSTGPSSGAHKVGITASSAWANADAGIAAGPLATGVLKIVSDLAATAGGSRVGVAAMMRGLSTVPAGNVAAQLAMIFSIAVAQGSKWRRIVSAGTLYAVERSTNIYVAVGASNVIRYSDDDGATWTNATTASGDVARVLLADTVNSVWVMAGDDGSIHTAPLTTPGTTTQRNGNSYTGVFFQAVAKLSGGLLVVGGSSGTVVTSPTGVTWTPRTFGSANEIRMFAVSSSLIVANDATGVRTSPDGIAWTGRTLPSSPMTVNALAYNAFIGLFIAGCGTNASSGGQVYTSPNGITWTLRDSPAERVLTLATNGNTIVAGCNDGLMRVSLDSGATWATATMPANLTGNILSARFNVDKAIFSAVCGTSLLKSSDGVVWVVDAVAPFSTTAVPAASDGFLYATGSTGSIFALD